MHNQSSNFLQQFDIPKRKKKCIHTEEFCFQPNIYFSISQTFAYTRYLYRPLGARDFNRGIASPHISMLKERFGDATIRLWKFMRCARSMIHQVPTVFHLCWQKVCAHTCTQRLSNTRVIAPRSLRSRRVGSPLLLPPMAARWIQAESLVDDAGKSGQVSCAPLHYMFDDED